MVDAAGDLIGVVTRRDLWAEGVPPQARVADVIRRPPVVAYAENSLREAADLMVEEGIGRLPVVARSAPRKIIGILTRSDLLAAHKPRLEQARRAQRVIRLAARRSRGRGVETDGMPINAS